ncbi:hypothetical protein Tco_0674896 [Tanacetum coccineum]
METIRRGGQPKFQEKAFKNNIRRIVSQIRFSLLYKNSKEISSGKKEVQSSPPMHGRMHAAEKANRRMIKSGKLSQFIIELKQNDKPKARKKGEASEKDKLLAILMIQPWEIVAKPRITQSFSPETAISFPPLGEIDWNGGTNDN